MPTTNAGASPSSIDPRVPQAAASRNGGLGVRGPDRLGWMESQGAKELAKLIGNSSSMQLLKQQLLRVGPTRATIFITGESGTGKEVVAECLHALSPARHEPFVAVNCGAIPEQLIEAELFGHEKGSFTGAVRTHAGHFERAGHGTLFLDEITEMPIEMQSKLLRVLESQRFMRVGGTAEIRHHCRILAASNRDPQKAVREGRMRADLLYRLAVFPLKLAPLREREGDAALLARHFLEELNRQKNTRKRLSPDSTSWLRQYAWPGNVRELRNTVTRAYILADEELDLRAAAHGSFAALSDQMVRIPLGTPLASAEHSLIMATLRQTHGNKTQAANLLGVSLKTLYNRLKYYRLSWHTPSET